MVSSTDPSLLVTTILATRRGSLDRGARRSDGLPAPTSPPQRTLLRGRDEADDDAEDEECLQLVAVARRAEPEDRRQEPQPRERRPLVRQRHEEQREVVQPRDGRQEDRRRQ